MIQHVSHLGYVWLCGKEGEERWRHTLLVRPRDQTVWCRGVDEGGLPESRVQGRRCVFPLGLFSEPVGVRVWWRRMAVNFQKDLAGGITGKKKRVLFIKLFFFFSFFPLLPSFSPIPFLELQKTPCLRKS